LLLGYLEFLGLLFLPGIAFIELFRAGTGYSFAERLALAFGLSLAIDVLVLAVRTSGLMIGSQRLLGLDPSTLGLMLGVPLVLLAGITAFRRRFAFLVAPSRDDLLVLAMVVLQSILVLAHFAKYPLFPEYQSVDFTQHVQITSALQSGGITTFPGGLLYYGVHLLMGSLGVLSGDPLLFVTQYAMGILTALSPFLLFSAVSFLTESRRTALVSTFLYVATGFVWFGSVFDAGLYANFVGLLFILFVFMMATVVVKKPKAPWAWLAFLLAVGGGYFSHYSFLTILPPLVALPLGVLVLERKVNPVFVAIPLVAIVPGVIGALLGRPDLVGLLLQFIQAQGGGSITGDTPLSLALAGFPVLRYVAVEITNDVATAVTVLLAALGVYLSLSRRKPLVWMIPVWLVAVMVVAPFSEAAWRFSYMTLPSLVILASITIERLLPHPESREVRRSKIRARSDYRRFQAGLAGIVVLLMVVNSWSWAMLMDASTNTSAANQTQSQILDSMKWLDANIPAGSRIVSVTSFDYTLIRLLYPGRDAGYVPLVSPNDVVASAASGTGQIYAILTKISTYTIVPDPSQNPFALYPSDSRFHLVYNNSMVFVYTLTTK